MENATDTLNFGQTFNPKEAINLTTPFYFPTKEESYPLPPLVTVREIVSPLAPTQLIIRFVVFIDSKSEVCPTINPNYSLDTDGVLHVQIDYNYLEEIPVSYNCFYLELDYTVAKGVIVNKVSSVLSDLDPKTSRGTVTMVLQSAP